MTYVHTGDMPAKAQKENQQKLTVWKKRGNYFSLQVCKMEFFAIFITLELT